MSRKTILLGLNEINFDYVKFYVDKGKLPALGALLKRERLTETTSESQYKLLEPWVQWVTVHTGKSYDEHKVFRLGDIVERKDLLQIFEELESHGKKVAAVSPFNADNRLKDPSFFVPDPWTKTRASGPDLVQKLSAAVGQTVNDNAQAKLSKSSIAAILKSVARYVPVSRYSHYVKAGLNRAKPGGKALILDSLLSDVFLALWSRNKPDFANLFLNSGAHVQHHYLFNSAAYEGKFKNPDWYCPEDYDPLLVILEEYDRTINRLLKLDINLIIATGLHQNPHENLTYYWRLKDHKAFLKQIGLIEFEEVLPRMSRDFLVRFATDEQAAAAEMLLESYVENSTKEKVFSIDNRGKTLFVELVYSNDLPDDTVIVSENNAPEVAGFKKYVAFVAIKNGEHNGIGYVLPNFNFLSEDRVPLTSIKDEIKSVVLGSERA